MGFHSITRNRRRQHSSSLQLDQLRSKQMSPSRIFPWGAQHLMYQVVPVPFTFSRHHSKSVSQQLQTESLWETQIEQQKSTNQRRLAQAVIQRGEERNQFARLHCPINNESQEIEKLNDVKPRKIPYPINQFLTEKNENKGKYAFRGANGSLRV